MSISIHLFPFWPMLFICSIIVWLIFNPHFHAFKCLEIFNYISTVKFWDSSQLHTTYVCFEISVPTLFQWKRPNILVRNSSAILKLLIRIKAGAGFIELFCHIINRTTSLSGRRLISLSKHIISTLVKIKFHFLAIRAVPWLLCKNEVRNSIASRPRADTFSIKKSYFSINYLIKLTLKKLKLPEMSCTYFIHDQNNLPQNYFLSLPLSWLDKGLGTNK